MSTPPTKFEVTLHRIEDGLPDMTDDALVGRVAFVWDGHVISGWPLTKRHLHPYEQPGSIWEPSDDHFGGPVAGVKHWIEFPVPIWELGKQEGA